MEKRGHEAFLQLLLLSFSFSFSFSFSIPFIFSFIFTSSPTRYSPLLFSSSNFLSLLWLLVESFHFLFAFCPSHSSSPSPFSSSSLSSTPSCPSLSFTTKFTLHTVFLFYFWCGPFQFLPILLFLLFSFNQTPSEKKSFPSIQPSLFNVLLFVKACLFYSTLSLSFISFFFHFYFILLPNRTEMTKFLVAFVLLALVGTAFATGNNHLPSVPPFLPLPSPRTCALWN